MFSPLSSSLPTMAALNMAAGVIGRNATAATATATATAATVATNNLEDYFNWNDRIAKLLISLLLRSIFNMTINNTDLTTIQESYNYKIGLHKIIHTRTIHSILVAMNLFWYQAIRQSVAILSVFMCTEFNTINTKDDSNNRIRMDTTQQAQLIAAPSVGNILTQAFGGSIIHLLDISGLGGTKTAISIALFGLAFGCTVLPLTINSGSSSSSDEPLLQKAFLLLALQGLFFGAMFPSHSVLLSKWLPPSERGIGMAYGEIAMSIASMIVPLVVTGIAEKYTNTIPSSTSGSIKIIPGWRNGFYVVGFGCFSYLFTWIIFGRNEPNVLHMIYNFVTLSINSWMPTYYNDVLGMPPSQSKIHIILPQICSLVVKLFVSKFALWLRQQKQNKLTTFNNSSNNKNNRIIVVKDEEEEEQRSTSILLFSRRLMSYIGFIVTAIPLWLLPIVANNASSSSTSTATTVTTNPRSSLYSPWYTTLLFCIALMGTGFHSESFRANYLDVTTENVGLISGIGNCLSSVSAMMAPFLVGKIIQKYSSGNNGSIGDGDGNNNGVIAGWSVVWKLSSISCIVAAVIFGSFSTTIPIEQQRRQQQKKEE
ncbi:MFS general substrate transporter [Fragilariopsis cylindrus CCMP1102]|uniref:MFS general substrate transporter n=1 Tax=Fragilariopsis cylindrus CCMP1102 TaxID=635003 RepID=A0A1E7ET22_9STRA|nr:MFS general substrate transporter [Fragilariopsis cylindrus CCMP1102]|eukprot:OEU09170.1 MFS general substrate transporter [Fragilariopsis cylindrus CCMP1102]